MFLEAGWDIPLKKNMFTQSMHICSQNYEKRKYNLLLFRENKCRIQIIKTNQEIHDSFYGFYV